VNSELPDPWAARRHVQTAREEHLLERLDAYEAQAVLKVCEAHRLDARDLRQRWALEYGRDTLLRFGAFTLLDEPPPVQYFTTNIVYVDQLRTSDFFKRPEKTPPARAFLKALDKGWLSPDRPAALLFNWRSVDKFTVLHTYPAHAPLWDGEFRALWGTRGLEFAMERLATFARSLEP
jgi:hypothetical protein